MPYESVRYGGSVPAKGRPRPEEERSARLSSDIYKKLNGLRDFAFKDQITRSGLSAPSNIAEGYERKSRKILSIFYLTLKVRAESCVLKSI